MTLMPHMFEMLGVGLVTVEVKFHDPVVGDGSETRRSLAEFCQRVVGRGLEAALSGRPPAAAPSDAVSANS